MAAGIFPSPEGFLLNPNPNNPMKLNHKNPFLSALATLAGFALSLAHGATETFNTPGTFNWVCPPGVTAIQVECWGGGGAGGAGTKVTNTGTNTSQNGGGGGGGAYARVNTVPVTPGLSYTITIPDAAVSVEAIDTTANTRGQSGGTVTFVGDLGVAVTAVGGQGGVSIWRNSNQTAGGGGGTGGSAGASIGDVVFSGGNGSAGNTGATNVSGSGGGGAGDTGAGGAGFTSTASPYVGAGAGGITGGGAGGVGRTGNPPTSGNSNEGPGTPGATPGGGGGGAKNQGVSSWLGGTGGVGQIVLTYTGPEVVKANNANDLNLTTSWTGGVVPTSGNRAKWDNTVTGASITSLGGDLTFGGIVIANPAGPVTINPGNTLTLGSELVDIDMSAATQDLTLACDLAMGAPNVWDVDSGRTLTLGGVVSGSALTKLGDGTAILQAANTWAGGTTVGAGTLQLGASEVIPNGAGTGNVTIDGTLDLNGFSEQVNGLGGSGTVDNRAAGTASVLTVGNNNQAGTFSGTLQNSGSSASLELVKTGTGALTLASANTHSGLTTTNGGALILENGGALGSTAAGTVVNGTSTGNAANARLDLSGGITVTGESLAISGVGDFFGALKGVGGNNEWAGNVTIGATGTRLGAAANATLKVSGVIDSGAAETGLVIRTANVTDSTVIVSNANTYLGSTWVAVGKLQLEGADNRLPVATKMRLGATTNVAEFDLNGTNQELAGLTIEPGATAANNTVNNSSATLSTLTVNTADSPSAFAGILKGNLALNKSGGDTLTLAGANEYTGATSVIAGTLLFSSAGSGASDVSVAAGASAGARVAATDGQAVNSGDLALGANSVLTIDYGATNPSTTVAPVAVDNFSVGAGLGLLLKGNNLAALTPSQSYPLVTWTTNGPADGSAFTSVLNPRIQGSFSVVGKTLFLVVSANTDGCPISWNTGNGAWDTTSPNWVDVNLATTTYFDTFDRVLFGDAAGATGNPVIALDSAFTPTGVVMNSTARDYTLTGTGAIGGNASLTLDPANTRTLTVLNANTFTGTAAVNGGTLRLGDGGADGSLAPAGAISVGSGATFAVNQSDTVTQGTDFGGAAISGAGNFAQSGAGTTVLNAANTYSGTTDISGGTLQAVVNSTANGLGTSATTVGAGTTLLLDNANVTSGATLTLNNTFGGTGLLQVRFTENANPRNIQMPNVTGFAGTVRLSSPGPTGDKWNASALGDLPSSLIVDPGNTLFIASGTLSFSGGITLNGAGNTEGRGAIRLSNATLGGNISLAGDSTINLDNAAAVLSGDIASGAAGTQTLTLGATASTGGILGGVLGGGPGTLNLATAVGGTYTLGNANTFTGTTTINAGILQLGNVDALGGSNPGVNGTSGIVMTGGTLRSNLDGVVIHAPITTSNSVRIGAPTNTSLGQNGTTLAVNGVIGGTGDVAFAGNASSNTVNIVLLNAKNDYSGSTTLDTYGVTASQVSVKLGTENALPTGTVLNIDGQAGAGTGRDTELNLNGFNQTLAGLTNTVRSLRVQRVVNSDVSPYATLTINNSGDFSFGANAGTNSSATIGGTARGSVGGAATPGSTTGSNLGLTKSGSGKFTLVNPNPYHGATTILGGILSLGSSGSMQSSPLDTLNSVAGDAANGLETTVTALTLGGLTGNKDLASMFTTTAGGYDGVSSLTLNPVAGATHGYSGAIADGAAGMTLTKAGAGTQILAGANSYTGATSVNAGTLALGASDVIPNGSPVSLGAATLDAATFSDSLGTLDVTAAATIHLGAGGTLAFADSSDPGLDWAGGTLTITGTFVPGQSLRFGTTGAGLTDGQLALISAPGFANFDLDPDGFLTATVAGYSAWAAVNAPTTGNDPAADEDGDGVSNGVEFVLGGTINTNDLGKLPALSTSGGNLVFSFERDQDSIDGSTVVEIEVGTTLASWPDVFVVPAGAVANSPGLTVVKDSSPGVDSVTLAVPRGTDPAKFARLKVTVTP
jgi:autotransporter-associated beta strand protein